ncbi:hypothetical protein L6164_037443 [Bauhinia variegata]|uniref:Uncharacterized protein n=1 Tax=Bauhinia variegata TaxID=167791 RepID=A0ACB9KK03_BAUVA|nr:hypothetical protein L6164_037443 [Bauhinia variegata]
MKTTYGLPYAYELAKHSRVNMSIPLSVVHSHWKTLCFGGLGRSSSTKPSTRHAMLEAKPSKWLPMLEWFFVETHGYIEYVIDVQVNGNCGYLFAPLSLTKVFKFNISILSIGYRDATMYQSQV